MCAEVSKYKLPVALLIRVGQVHEQIRPALVKPVRDLFPHLVVGGDRAHCDRGVLQCRGRLLHMSEGRVPLEQLAETVVHDAGKHTDECQVQEAPEPVPPLHVRTNALLCLILPLQSEICPHVLKLSPLLQIRYTLVPYWTLEMQ